MNSTFMQLTMDVPGLAPLCHLAEVVVPDGAGEGLLVRIMELDESGTIRGAGRPGLHFDLSNEPLSVVPHPDTYKDMEDIDVQFLDPHRFEAMWAEACIKWPALS